MSQLREQFLRHMSLKGYSEQTKTVYLDSIIGLTRYYNLSPEVLTTEHLSRYLHYGIEERGWSRSSVNQLISAMKILWTRVLNREWNPEALPRPRRARTLPVVLSREEVLHLFDVVTNIKHRTLLMLTYSSGLRIGETLGLKTGDIDSHRMMIRIHQGKGNKDRYAVLSQVALEQLRLYYKLYRPVDWLFETGKGRLMSRRTAQMIMQSAVHRAGISKKVSLHTLRHSFATHLMEQGVSLAIIQQMLGHGSLRTTSIYLHVQQYAIDKIKSPLDSTAE
jgi:integrase/recombinase XerD